MRQLNQRISVRFETKTLSKADTENYIRHRLAIAGAPSRLRFGSGVFGAVWRHSKGYPRLINLICDRALLAGYMDRTFVITRKLVRRAAMGLKGEEMGRRFAPGWFQRMAPYIVPGIILLFFLCFMVYRVLAH
jgi:general secretion pathway protein A